MTNRCADLDTTSASDLKTLEEAVEGRLGERPCPSARLSPALQVADAMTCHPLTFDPDLPVRAAAMVLFYRRIGGAPVVTAAGELLGVFSEADVLDEESAVRGLAGKHSVGSRRSRARTVGEACTKPARVTRPDAAACEAARELLDQRIGRLVVVDGSRLVGIVTRRDLVPALVRTDVELQPLVDGALAALAEPDVVATIDWGEATLTGTATGRGQVPRIAAAIAAMDGIVAVEERLDSAMVAR